MRMELGFKLGGGALHTLGGYTEKEASLEFSLLCVRIQINKGSNENNFNMDTI
jgi:hypothetical protein